MSKLYVVATPIGNLNDLTPRMREALEAADLIAAEDTRVTMKLLSRFELKKPMISCHRHNEDGRATQLVERMLAEDLTVAITCDAGTPGISDPGHILVAEAWKAGIRVEPVCGPSAVVTAISASGFDAREFAFYGFLPREKKALREKLESIRKAGVPVFVLYESPHRIVDLSEQIAQMWPEAMLLVCSDLTKKFERLYRGTAAEVVSALKANENVEKGEYCMVVDISALPEKEEEPSDTMMTPELFILNRLLEGDDLREAAGAAIEAGFARNAVYKAKIRISDMFEE